MFAAVLLSVSVCLVLYICSRWLRVRNYWNARGVPSQPPHPLLGSLKFLQQINIMEWLMNEYRRYPDAPYFGIWLFWRPALVVKDPQIARRVLVKDFDVFRDRFLSSGQTDPIGGLNIFTANDPLWSSVRRRLTSVFTASKLRALHPLIDGKAKELVQRIQKDHVDDDKPMNLRDIFADYTTDIIGAAAFGVAGDATLTGKGTMREITKVFASYSVVRGLEFATMFFWPQLCDMFRVKFFTKKTTAYFREVFKKIVTQRGGWSASINENRDLVDALLKLRQQSKADGEEMSDDVIIAQAAIFLQGGFDTSAVALTFATYELAFHQQAQEKLYTELNEARISAGKDLDPTALIELPYLTCVIKETLRKYPAMGYLDRVATRDYKVDDKLTIQKGTPVYVCGIGMQYDPEYFPDPTRFDPERFSAESCDKIEPFTWMPFGEGPRNCIGMRFAYQTLRSALSYVVLHYQVVALPGAPAPHEVHFDPRGIFMAPDRVLAVQFVPRK